MATDKMIARKDGSTGWMIFNNPERHNAVSLEMWQAAETILDDFERDAEVGVIVMTGAGGKAFVSGADISKFESERASEQAVEAYNVTTDRLYQRLGSLTKPTIAMIRGYCVGGGVALAISCDLRICTEASRFAVPAAKLGLGYRFPGVQRLIDLVGPSFTKEIFFTARQFSAAEAASMGLVNRVVADAELEDKVKDYATTIAGNAPLTVASIKRMVGEAMKDPEDRDLEMCDRLVRECFASQDYIEGRRAFMEKRKPVFAGR
ncbi:MAG: enoyl-CoA hydratase [Alphaproteobacteria bacterium]|nr:enoyl-CoA hydratase [Alphaproteobacteria bacterium]